MTTTAHETEITADPEVPVIRISREFNAPRHKVFRAHVDPELLVRWLGPRDLEMAIDYFDCRTGGAYRYVHRRGDDEFGFHGSFHEVRPDELIVQTFTYEGVPDGVALERATFEAPEDGRTRLTVTSLVGSFAERDAMLASGMEHGVREGYEKLDELLRNSGVIARYRRAARGFTQRVDAVTGEGWDRPAPCAGWVARDVVSHLVEWVPAFFREAGGPTLPEPAEGVAPAEAWHRLDDAIQALLDTPEVAAMLVEHPRAGRHRFDDAVGQFVTGDVLIHTWDLARACGLDETLDPELVHDMLVGNEPLDAVLRASGQYGPRIDVPADADEQTRLIAFTGRQP